MGEIPLLKELAIVVSLGVVVTVLLARLKLPTVGGLLAAGALMGPYALGLVDSVHDIEMLAEVGVVLLLFTIGLEFSLERLRDIFRQVALGGALQVGLTAAVTAGISLAFAQPVGRSVFYGFAVALSSTAIVLRMLSERQELDAPHGRFIVGTLIFQDLCVVPMVLIVPLLAPGEDAGGTATALTVALGKAAAVVVATIGLARLVVPRALDLVEASRSREIFLLAILGLCIGTAWLTSLAGLSLALGAFLAGMVVSGTEHGHRAMSDILPLRDAFVSVFFVTLGMLFDPAVLFDRPVAVAAMLLGFLVAKGAIATLAALAMRFPPRAAWLGGIGLAQFGEFGFVLTRLAQDHGVVDAADTAPLLAAGILSMFLTPILVLSAPHLTAGERMLAPLSRVFGVRGVESLADPGRTPLHDHIVIVGYGIAGTVAARAVQDSGTPVVVLEVNVENVRRGREAGLPVYYGDATSDEVLRHAGLPSARMIVVLVNDPGGAQRIVDAARRIAPRARVLVRTRYLRDRARLLGIGAHDVVADEIEAAVEVVARVLRSLETPRNLIESRIRDVRSSTQTSERKQTIPRSRLGDLRGLDDMKIESLAVTTGSPAEGRSPVEMELRRRTGALVVAVRRDGQLDQGFDSSAPFRAGDVVFLVGTSEAVREAVACFAPAGVAPRDEITGDAHLPLDPEPAADLEEPELT